MEPHGAESQPTQAWSGYGPPTAPPPWHAPPPQPPRKRSRWLIALLLCIPLLALGCLGAAGYGLFTAVRTRAQAAGDAPDRTVAGSPARGGSTAHAESDDAPTGPRASSYPVRSTDDLARVCDGWYYPQSPKLAGKAPHPINISVRSRPDQDFRSPESNLDLPYTGTAAIRRAWEPKKLDTVQLIACVDFARGGKAVRKCKFDDPKPDTIPLKDGVYRLSLYEVATHRKVFTKQLTGEDDDCPYFVLLGSDRTLYTEPNDRQYVEALRRYVEK